MHRRQFLRSAPLAAAAGLSSVGLAGAADNFPHGEPRMKRFDDQRWVLDNIIQANGVDWDQGHTSVLLRSCGLAVQGDMAGLRQRVKKYADIVPAFEALAKSSDPGLARLAAIGFTFSIDGMARRYAALLGFADRFGAS